MLKVVKWAGIILVVGFVALVVGRMVFFIQRDKTEAQVEKIHHTKLTRGDVMGENIAPLRLRAGQADYDATVEGIDENKNGIRDDVELAIFAAYPNSARTRAVLLQYALALQMEVTQEIVNEGTVIAGVQEEDRAYLCVGKILSRDNMEKYAEESERLRSFVKERQVNTEERKKARTIFYDKIGSYESLDRICDIDYSTLPN